MAIGEFFTTDLGNNGGVFGSLNLIPTGTNMLLIMSYGVSHAGLHSVFCTVSATGAHMLNHTAIPTSNAAGLSAGGAQGNKWIISNTNYYTSYANYVVQVAGSQIQ